MNRLAGKVALITGGGSGIGAATARLMCSEGAKVMLVDANPEGLASTHKNIAERVPGASIETFQADVSDHTKAIDSVEETLRAFIRLDILVNNASMRNYSAIGDAKPEEWQAMASVNKLLPRSVADAAEDRGRQHRQRIFGLCRRGPQRHGTLRHHQGRHPRHDADARLRRGGTWRPRQRRLSGLDADQLPYQACTSRRQNS